MAIIKFKIITPSKLEIRYNNKMVIVSGEMTLTPIFYANINDFFCWSYPFEHEKITEKEREKIVKFITQESQKEGKTKIIFD